MPRIRLGVKGLRLVEQALPAGELAQEKRSLDKPRVAGHQRIELGAIQAEAGRLLELQKRQVSHRANRRQHPIQRQRDGVGRAADERQPRVGGQRILPAASRSRAEPRRTIPHILLEPLDLRVADRHPHDDPGGARRQQVDDVEDLSHGLASIVATRSLRGELLRDAQIAIVEHPQLPLADGQEPGRTNGPGHGLIDGGAGAPARV